MQKGETKAGFVIKTRRSNDDAAGAARKNKVFINVVSSEHMRGPVSASGVEVSMEELDRRGLESLQVPLDVIEKTTVTDRRGDSCDVVDVIFNPSVVQRALNGHSQQYFRNHLTNLSLKFAEDSLGYTLSRATRVLNRVNYKGPNGNTTRSFIMSSPSTDGSSSSQHPRQRDAESVQIIDDSCRITSSDLNPISSTRTSTKPAVKKGFFANAHAPLYPNGSTEGTPPPGAGDPLGFLPEKLRNRVHVVDPRNGGGAGGENDTMRSAIEEYAATGKVSAQAGVRPAAAGADNSKDSTDSIVGGGSVVRPEHTIETTEDGAGVKVVVQLPLVESMAEVDLDVSALEIDLKVPERYRLVCDWSSKHGKKKVDVDTISAKFLKKKRQLILTATLL